MIKISNIVKKYNTCFLTEQDSYAKWFSDKGLDILLSLCSDYKPNFGDHFTNNNQFLIEADSDAYLLVNLNGDYKKLIPGLDNDDIYDFDNDKRILNSPETVIADSTGLRFIPPNIDYKFVFPKNDSGLKISQIYLNQLDEIYNSYLEDTITSVIDDFESEDHSKEFLNIWIIKLSYELTSWYYRNKWMDEDEFKEFLKHNSAEIPFYKDKTSPYVYEEESYYSYRVSEEMESIADKVRELSNDEFIKDEVCELSD